MEGARRVERVKHRPFAPATAPGTQRTFRPEQQKTEMYVPLPEWTGMKLSERRKESSVAA